MYTPMSGFEPPATGYALEYEDENEEEMSGFDKNHTYYIIAPFDVANKIKNVNITGEYLNKKMSVIYKNKRYYIIYTSNKKINFEGNLRYFRTQAKSAGYKIPSWYVLGYKRLTGELI